MSYRAIDSYPFSKLSAPRENGRMLAVPSPETWADLARRNRRTVEQSSFTLSGVSLFELRRAARLEMLAAARRHTHGDSTSPQAPCSPEMPLFMAGHQPELFHPGVWAKNFALHEASRSAHGLAVNLIVDGDLTRGSSINVPCGDMNQPRLESIEFDAPCPRVAWEEQRFADEARIASFPERVFTQLIPMSGEPVLAEFWKGVRSYARPGAPVGLAFGRARQRLEASLGVNNLEVPQSQLASGQWFFTFAAMLALNARKFAECYNTALHDYRVRNGLRSRSHPAPDLAFMGDWVELPLWCWSSADPRRTPVFARPATSGVEIRGVQGEIRLLKGDDAQSLAESWRSTCQTIGWKTRPRALLTTLYARLLLCDFFIHGLGGGKYDAVTNEIIESFFGVSSPSFAVVTGTLRLPFAHAQQTMSRELSSSELLSQLWQLRHHGELYLPNGPCGNVEEIAAEKRRLLIDPPPDGASRKEWTLKLRGLNQKLFRLRQDEADALNSRLKTAQRQAANQKVLASRDYAFCLHPLSMLRPFLLRAGSFALDAKLQ